MITLGPKSPFLERAVDLSNRLIDFALAEGYAPGEMAMAANLIVMRLIEANEASKASVFFEPRTVREEGPPPAPHTCWRCERMIDFTLYHPGDSFCCAACAEENGPRPAPSAEEKP